MSIWQSHPQMTIAQLDLVSVPLGWFARFFMEKGGVSRKGFDKGVCTFSDVLIKSSKVWVEMEW